MIPVTIHLYTCQQVDNQLEEYKTTLHGHYSYTPHTCVLDYIEQTPEGDFATRITVCTKKRNPVVTLCRADNTLTVEQAVLHTGPYTMGPCRFELGTFGKAVDNALHAAGGKLTLCYELTINGTPASANQMKITIEP